MDSQLAPAERDMPPMPIDYLIDTGNLCNLRCPFCPTGIRRENMSTGLMSFETFEMILRKLGRYAYHVELMNWGEPFLNPDLLRMIRLAADAGIRVAVDSNLSRRDFSDEVAEAIVRSGVWSFRGSIDGASAATYSKYRRRGKFERALANLARVAQAKARLGSGTPRVEWQFLINRFNEHEIETAKAMAHERALTISYLPMEVWGHTEWRSSVHDVAASGGFHPAKWRFFEQRPVPSEFFQPRDWTGVSKWQPSLPAEVPEGCAQPFNRMSINWDGRVLPCCMCYGDNFYVGDLHVDSAEAIWSGMHLRMARRFLANYGPKQDTGSVCEEGACALGSKYIGEPDSERERRAHGQANVVPVASLFAKRTGRPKSVRDSGG